MYECASLSASLHPAHFLWHDGGLFSSTFLVQFCQHTAPVREHTMNLSKCADLDRQRGGEEAAAGNSASAPQSSTPDRASSPMVRTLLALLLASSLCLCATTCAPPLGASNGRRHLRSVLGKAMLPSRTSYTPTLHRIPIDYPC